MRMTFILIAALCVCLPVSSVAASPYDGDLARLSGELQALMFRADQPAANDPRVRLELQEKLVGISKQLHRIAEQAMQVNLDLEQSGQLRKASLTFAAQIAETLDLAQSDTSAYLDTRATIFRTAAATAAQSARELVAAE